VSNSVTALCVHQMIPHHQNAVNMAKAFLASGLDCSDITSNQANCILKRLSLEMISHRNHEIQIMRGVLEQSNLVGDDDCQVPISSTGDFSLVNGKQIDGQDYCAMPISGEDLFVTLEPCTGALDQKWVVIENGGLQSKLQFGGVELCMINIGTKVTMGQCEETEKGDVVTTIDGEYIGMSYRKDIYFVSLGGENVDGITVLKLKLLKNRRGQRWTFNYLTPLDFTSAPSGLISTEPSSLTESPTKSPTFPPTKNPTESPTESPTKSPTVPP